VYAALAQSEGETILAEARERFGDIDAIGVHRSGRLAVGELAVWVGVSSPHRDAAFGACRYIIDAIKHRLPVWKKELYVEGDSEWVVCSHGGNPHSHGASPHADHP
jgi:molybdopterin synthase catalytic subunit